MLLLQEVETIMEQSVLSRELQAQWNGKLRELAGLSAAIGMTTKEIKRYNVLRALRSQLLIPGAKETADFELECSAEVAKRVGHPPQGIYVPTEVLQNRDLTVASPTGGGYLVATENAPGNTFISSLRARSVTAALGVRTLGDLRATSHCRAWCQVLPRGG
jgi:hypothetical protein